MATPADKVIEVFGGVRATARMLGLNSSSVSRWRMPADKRGLNGRVPSVHQGTILRIARERGLRLSAADLIYDSVA
jgi:transposase-like protein